MRCTVYKQWSRGGRRLKKPRADICDLSLDTVGDVAWAFLETRGPVAHVLYRIRLASISADGFLLAGVESSDGRRHWFQEWWCVPVPAPEGPKEERDAADRP